MKNKLIYTTIFFLFISLFNIQSQDPSKHQKWQLNGADDRIEKNRKGNVKIEFITTDGITKRSNASLDLELVNHDFKFGASFTQLRRFWGQDYGDLYLERFNE